MDYSIVVPTFNGGASWQRAAAAISAQRPKPQRILIIDSDSADDSVAVSKGHGFEVVAIASADFDHGGTRQAGVELLPEAEFIVFLTQDAVLLAQDSIALLVRSFKNTKVGVAYGRQVAGPDASLLEKYTRAFNYPEQSMVKSIDSIPALGIKTVFCSNSFAAYRRSALQNVGGFSKQTLFAEDMLVAARMVHAGFNVAYDADAVCEHSHDYTVAQEFRRAFDIGVFHRREHWILEEFGGAKSEGGSFVFASLLEIASADLFAVPLTLMKYIAKVFGYTVGRAESVLPVSIKRTFSMNRSFWKVHG